MPIQRTQTELQTLNATRYCKLQCVHSNRKRIQCMCKRLQNVNFQQQRNSPRTYSVVQINGIDLGPPLRHARMLEFSSNLLCSISMLRNWPSRPINIFRCLILQDRDHGLYSSNNSPCIGRIALQDLSIARQTETRCIIRNSDSEFQS